MKDLPEVRGALSGDHALILEAASRLADFDLPKWRNPRQVVEAELEALAGALKEPAETHAVFVAERESLLGFVYVVQLTDYFTRLPHGHVSMLAVFREAEGLGAGSALMAAAEEWSRERSHSFLTLNVFATNERARALYERMSFQVETLKYVKVLDLEGTEKDPRSQAWQEE